MVDARCELHACRLKQAEDQLKSSNVAKEDKDWATDGVTFFSICLEAPSNAMKFAHSLAFQAASKANHQHLDTAGEWSYQSSHLGKHQNIQWKVKDQDPQLVDSMSIR